MAPVFPSLASTQLAVEAFFEDLGFWAYNFSMKGTANCHCRLSRALASVSNGPSVQLRITVLLGR